LKEVKKRQQKILMILDSKNIKYEILDISEPGKETDKEFMHANSTSKGATASDMDPRHPLPPQVFNDDEYCGDFDQFELANEVDNLEVFLKLSPEEIPQLNKSTLDTSKIDESRPNGKVIDDDKENKTEDVQNQV
jgi:glutaredoxin-related protein